MSTDYFNIFCAILDDDADAEVDDDNAVTNLAGKHGNGITMCVIACF